MVSKSNGEVETESETEVESLPLMDESDGEERLVDGVTLVIRKALNL